MNKYRRIECFAMGYHVIHIQVRRDGVKKWLTTLYRLRDPDLEEIINDWPIKWKVLVNIEELSDMEVGPPSNIFIKEEQENESDKESEEESSKTPTKLEVER